MVDAEKAKQPKVKKNKNSNLPDINLNIGPLYIGYEAKSYLKAVILGIVGATPLLYMAFAGFLGAYTPTEMGDLITSVAILGLGALMAFFGAYLYQGRAKAKEKELKMFQLNQKRKNSKIQVMLKRTLLTYSFRKAEGKNNLNSMDSIWNSHSFFYTILFFLISKTKNYFYT